MPAPSIVRNIATAQLRHVPSRICSRLRLRLRCAIFFGGRLSMDAFTLLSFSLCIFMQCMFHCRVIMGLAEG